MCIVINLSVRRKRIKKNFMCCNSCNLEKKLLPFSGATFQLAPHSQRSRSSRPRPSSTTHFKAKLLLIWQNWAHNQKCAIQAYFEPQDVEDLKHLVRKLYRKKRGKIRGTGSGHSWGPIVCDCDGDLDHHDHHHSPQSFISSKFLNQILSLEIDHDKGTALVTCESGVTLYQLGIFLEMNGFTLANYPTPWEIQIAGTILTATHGSGHTGTLSSFVRKIGLFGKDGDFFELKEHAEDKREKELFLTANVGIGMTGFLSTVSLECVRQRFFDAVTVTVSAKHVFTFLDQWIADFHLEYFSLMWFWKPNRFLFTAYVESGKHIQLPSYFKKSAETNHKTLFQQVMGTGGVIRLEAEYAVPIFRERRKTLEQLCTMLRPILVHSHYPTPNVFIRFCNPDHNSYLSPTSVFLNGRFPTNQIPHSFLYTIIRTPQETKFIPFFLKIQKFFFIQSHLHGNFHWAKFWRIDHKLFNQIYKGARHTFKKWVKNRDRLDPERKFWNPNFDFFPREEKSSRQGGEK
jgi:hypothetical protein